MKVRIWVWDLDGAIYLSEKEANAADWAGVGATKKKATAELVVRERITFNQWQKKYFPKSTKQLAADVGYKELFKHLSKGSK